MSDTPIAVPVMMGAWQPTDEQIAKAAERAKLKAQRDAEDAARAVAGTTTLVCIAGFTRVTDEYPNGQLISPGQDFEVSDFDLHKYAGKGVLRG